MLALLTAAVLTAAGPQPVDRTVTFSADVAPIIRSRCVTCHRPGGDGPFSLASLDEVRRRASMIVAVTKSRYMPPWKPAPGIGDFAGSRRMSDAEIAIIERWVQGGLEPGTASAIVVPDDRGWERGEPDLILQLPAYTLPAGGRDVFRNFVVSVPAGATRIVRGLQFRPGNRAVHHANIRIDASPASRRLDEADPAPGYEGIIARSADFPGGQFLGWMPGQIAPALSDDTAWRLQGGADLVVQLHLRPTGAAEPIAPSIGLYFGDRAPSRTPAMIRLGRQDLDIAAGARAHTVTDSFILPVAVEVLAIQPHAHYRARSVEAHAVLPEGSRRPLIRIDDWDINWQDRYLYQSPVKLPAGTRLSMSYVFDNTTGNPRNPDRPPVRARWGWRSTDEMADVWLQVVTNSDDDRARLVTEVSRKMLTEDAIGVEVLLAREPDHINLRNDAAQIYLALGKPWEAMQHFSAVVRRQPNSAAAWFNEATALEALGHLSEAKARYRQALNRDPDYSPALNNLGALQLREGLVAEARDAFNKSINSDPANADAHANLGLVLIAGGQPDVGMVRVTRALELKPELLARLTPHAWLLAANDDPTARRPAEALALAERIGRVSSDRAGVLDLLAACQAAAGDFDRAVQTAGAALSAAPAGQSDLRRAITARIALYRRGTPYVLPR